MRLPSRHWNELSHADFERLRASGDAARAVALLPLGATEQHGPHLPTGVDSLLADAFVAAALPHLPSDLPLLVLPTQTLGLSTEHAAFAGTLTLRPETLLALWLDLAAGVAAAGLRRLLLFNAHGGNAAPMEIAAREIRARHGLLTVFTGWHQLPLGDAQALFPPDEWRYGVHAGGVETALLLALRPDLVRRDACAPFANAARARAALPVLGQARGARVGWLMQDLNPEGAAGDAAAADAAQGRALVAAVGASLAALIADVASLPLPDSD